VDDHRVDDRRRVMIIDDDDGIREMLQSALTFAGFRVTCATDGPTALELLTTRGTDAIVLDVMMPGVDGFEVVQLLRHRGNSVPVLFLSARDTVQDRVKGLQLGGDDYLTKPFSIVEVVARLESLLRRSQVRPPTMTEPSPTEPPALRCGDLELDESRHRVRRGGVAIELSPTEFRLLAYLMRNQGRVLSKAQILEHVWHYDFGGEVNVVERFVSNLRRKIDPLGSPLLHTVRGFGYTIRTDAG
jgi:two-component system OmpR family response regulator